MSYKVDFRTMDWESPMAGVRHKVVDREGVRLRLAEYRVDMEPHWCERGHVGRILEGTFEIVFEDEAHIYEAGDGVFIPSGAEHKHMARVIDGPVLALFVEKI